MTKALASWVITDPRTNPPRFIAIIVEDAMSDTWKVFWADLALCRKFPTREAAEEAAAQIEAKYPDVELKVVELLDKDGAIRA